MLQIGFYHVVLENGVYVDGPKSHKYIVLLPKDGESPWATLPDPAKHFKLLRSHEKFTISDENPNPEVEWYEELSAAYYDGELSNNIGHGDSNVIYDSEMNVYGGDILFELNDISYTYDWCGELLLPKTFDTTRFDLHPDNELHVPAEFEFVSGDIISGTNYGNDNVVINVWKRTLLDTNYTYKYKAYQVKDREFANELSLNISAGGTVNETTLSLAWSGATKPVTTSSGVPYYFVGVDVCGTPETSIIETEQEAMLDGSFEAVNGFGVSDKNTLLHATTTIIADNSFSLVRLRPYYTIVNSDNTTDELSGNAENLFFMGYELPVISEINIGNVKHVDAQGSYYPFNAEDQKGTLLEERGATNIGASGEYIIQILTSGGAGYRTEESAGGAGNNKHDSTDHADVSVNFLVTVQDMSDLDMTFEFDTSFGDSSYVAVPQQHGPEREGGGGLWGTSGEYYLSIPVTTDETEGNAHSDENEDTSGVLEGKKFKVTLEPYINILSNVTENISGTPIVKYLYTRPSIQSTLNVSTLIEDDASGNPTHITSTKIIDLNAIEPSGDFISKVELFRDNNSEPFKTLNPVVTRVNDELEFNEDAESIFGTEKKTEDTTATPESAHRYTVKVHYEHGWEPLEVETTDKHLIYRDLKLKDYGFEHMIIRQLTEVSDNGITYDLSAVDISLIFKPFTSDNSMYKHYVTMADEGKDGLLDVNPSEMKYYYINAHGSAVVLGDVDDSPTDVANYEYTPTGIMMTSADLSDVKLLDLSYSVIVDKNIAGSRIIRDVRDEDVSGKDYLIHNYVDNKVTNVVVEPVHTDHDAIPDQTLLAFERPHVYSDELMTNFGELDTFELVIDGVTHDISIEEGGQLIPNSQNPIELRSKFNFTDAHGEERITSEKLHGEHGLDLRITRPDDNTVTFSSPNDVNSHPSASNMSIVDFGDCSGYLKFTASSSAVGAILFRTHGEYGNEDEICGWHSAELLDTSATGEYLGWTGVSGTGITTAGSENSVVGSWSIPSSGPNKAPIGYIDFSFDNVDDHEYKFGIHMDDCSYGDKYGARLVYSNNGATAVSNLKMVPFNSEVAPADPGVNDLEITGVTTTTSPNQVTFEMKENELLGVAAKYEIIVYEVPAIHPNSENDYNMWDGSGDKVTATAKEQHEEDNDWKNTTWERLHLHAPHDALTASSMSNSVTLSNSKLKPNKVYVAKCFVINTNGNIRSLKGTDAIAFDVVELGNMPTVSLVPNVIADSSTSLAEKAYATVTLNQPYDPAARYIQLTIEGDNSIDADDVNFKGQFMADGNDEDNKQFGFTTEALRTATGDGRHLMKLTEYDEGSEHETALFANHFTTHKTSNFDLDAVLPKNIIGTWDSNLKFYLGGGGADLDLSSDNWPDISLTIYPSIYSDRPSYGTANVALQLYEPPLLLSTPSLNNYNNGIGLYLREYASSTHFPTGFNIERNQVLVKSLTTTPTQTSNAGGHTDTIIMVVAFETDDSEGITVKTFNRPENDESWSLHKVDKVFTIDEVPAGGMIVSVTVILSNNVGSSSSGLTTATYVDE